MEVKTLADASFYHSLGKQDCLCELLMRIRQVGLAKSLDEVVSASAGNPHAEWVKENMLEILNRCES